MKICIELRKDIVGFEGYYQISNFGRVKSLFFNHSNIEKKLSQPINKRGYKTIKLYKGGKHKTYYIHRLVAETFIHNPENKRTVNHKDGNKSNNNISNLEWATDKENVNHSYNNGLQKGKQVIQKDKDGNTIKIWNRIMDIERELKIPHSNICFACKSGINAGGYRWFYL